MPDKDQKIIAAVAEALKKLGEEQKERFLGVCEGVALYADREKKEESKTA